MPNVLELTPAAAAKTMDCMLLPYAETNYAQFERASVVAAEHCFGGVYVAPYMLTKLSNHSKNLLKKSEVKLCSFIADSLGSFPGITGISSEEMVDEISNLAEDGAEALDFALFSPAILGHETVFLKDNIETFVSTCKALGVESRIIIAIDRLPEEVWDYAFSLLTDKQPDIIKVGSELLPAYARPSMLDILAIRKLYEKYQLRSPLAAMNINFETTAYALLQVGADRLHIQNSVFNGVTILKSLPAIQKVFSVASA